MKKGNRYGTHRVIEPKGILPQPAVKISNDMEIYDNEILIDVQTLNIDSASFTQIYNQAEKDLAKTEEIIKGIVEERGKHQNPVTGSGGMLIGTIEEIGEGIKDTTDLKVGDKIATLVSLSLTPLRIDNIKEIRPEIDQVDIDGKAILFESGIYAVIPDDLPENLTLSVLDVAGAPAQTAKICKFGDTVMVIGGPGKAGMLCLYEAKRRVGPTGKVICVNYDETRFEEIKEMGIADVCIAADATDAVGLLQKIEEVTNGELCDVVINCVNVENTEMASILCTKDEGLVYFFSMATSFTKAALGAEGVGKDVNMMIGNGYTKGHGELTIQIMRDSDSMRELYTKLFA
ncbi:zinc-binding dehydrogenase [Peptoniphilus sp. KCTC 25270]|uniref:L-erythro-3,5-diaminohexanoate dehydrogenase n=1 Tax=Peptoniphilus sp. KCTC 25270 TaxID=2897414 RepID=UPI001E2C3D1E|nr:zinc-binding dehydrogenase [Peptoniphilus sp. KCTC 25270]MCD1147634.1 zinc-binding dehydrogenase [Peptoniphilus sp. KCTC 25270]